MSQKDLTKVLITVNKTITQRALHVESTSMRRRYYIDT